MCLLTGSTKNIQERHHFLVGVRTAILTTSIPKKPDTLLRLTPPNAESMVQDERATTSELALRPRVAANALNLVGISPGAMALGLPRESRDVVASLWEKAKALSVESRFGCS